MMLLNDSISSYNPLTNFINPIGHTYKVLATTTWKWVAKSESPPIESFTQNGVKRKLNPFREMTAQYQILISQLKDSEDWVASFHGCLHLFSCCWNSSSGAVHFQEKRRQTNEQWKAKQHREQLLYFLLIIPFTDISLLSEPRCQSRDLREYLISSWQQYTQNKKRIFSFIFLYVVEGIWGFYITFSCWLEFRSLQFAHKRSLSPPKAFSSFCSFQKQLDWHC